MNYIKISKKLLTVSIVYFISYNTYFGWNKNPESKTEETCDYIFNSLLKIVVTIYFTPVLVKYENWINEK